MVSISSNPNEWPQNQYQISDEKKSMVMDQKSLQSQPQQQQQQQQAPLKCPRCDSSNTKFCYYNNYSLSQPRHFCKACKRYWTRGGTLRNVPVGGGCRKNKRVKRPSPAPSSSSLIHEGGGLITSSTANPNNNNNNPCSSSSNPLFYGLPTNSSDNNMPNPVSEMNLPIFPGRFSTSRSSLVVDSINSSGYVQPQLLNGLGLGFSSEPNNNNGFPIFGASTSSHSSSSTPTVATLLASTLHQQKFPNFEDLRLMGTCSNTESASGGGGGGICMRQVKVEQDQLSRNKILEWNHHQVEQIGGFSNSSSDPNNSVFWNNFTTSTVGAWHDPTNIGSSVPSLI